MKKLFIAAMALATIVSCSKDDGAAVLESSKKAVSITIVNGASETRAVEEIAAFDTNDGGVGTIQDQAKADACAKTSELVVLFANKAGTVEDARSFASATVVKDENGEEIKGKYTYRWHGISESVTQIAVVRYDEIETTDLDSYKGTDLSVYQKAAADVDKMENIDITAINLYVAADLNLAGDCQIETSEHVFTTYKLFTADVIIAPTIARVEITGIACDGGDPKTGDELGATTLAAAKGELKSGGYDKLTLGSIVWGAKDEYTFDLNDFVLEGIYAGEGNTTPIKRKDYSAGDGKAITWNIDPSAEVPQIGKNPMVIDMKAFAHDYKVVNEDKSLSIGFGEKVQKFAPGNIYRMSINFGENNLDESNESICVEVKVTVTDWVVVNVTPVFGNN